MGYVQTVRTVSRKKPLMMHAVSFPLAAVPRTNGIILPLSLRLRFQWSARCWFLLFLLLCRLGPRLISSAISWTSGSTKGS